MQFWVLKMIGQTKIIKNHKATKLGQHPMDLRTCNRMPKTPGWRRKAQLLQHCDAALKTWGLAGRHLGPFGPWKKSWSLTDTKLQRLRSEELRSEDGTCLLERRFSLSGLFPLSCAAPGVTDITPDLKSQGLRREAEIIVASNCILKLT